MLENMLQTILNSLGELLSPIEFQTFRKESPDVREFATDHP